MGLFDGDPTWILQEGDRSSATYYLLLRGAGSRQRYNVFGNLFVEPTEISTASAKDLCLYIKGTGLLNLS
jgi:hypothetical protein